MSMLVLSVQWSVRHSIMMLIKESSAECLTLLGMDVDVRCY